MKRILAITTAVAVLVPSLSLAQPAPFGPGGQNDHQGGRPAGQPGRPGPGAAPNPHPGGPPPPPAPGGMPQRPGPGGGPPYPGAGGGPPRPGFANQPRPMPGYPSANRPPAERPPFAGRPGAIAQPLPPRGNQFWHRDHYYPRIRGPAYAYPPGWQYRRWTIGAFLPGLLLAPAFFYAGWAALGLEAPPPGYAWVRYGPDLLEVNLATGEVADAVYGAFY